jgi:phage terminase Nu1 subunit (DNA packaging protein)
MEPTYPANNHDPGEPWVKKQRIAGHYSISLTTVKRWVAAGCPCRVIANEKRFRFSEVDAWITQQSNDTAEAA